MTNESKIWTGVIGVIGAISLFSLMAALALYGLVAMIHQYHEQHDQASILVFKVCNSSRMSMSNQLKHSCGEMQYVTHTEFICEENNRLITNHCWVEKK